MPFEEELDRHITILKEIGAFFNIDISNGICKLEDLKIKIQLEEARAESISSPDSPHESWMDDTTKDDNEEEINKIFSYLDEI